MASPSDTRSPTSTWIPATVPAAGDGISIVALSDSSVSSGSSARDLVAFPDQDLDHRHVLEVADSGTLTSIVSYAPAGEP